MTTTHVLETAGATIAYDVRGPLPTADGRPPLFMIGQPMDASGFDTLASHFPHRSMRIRSARSWPQTATRSRLLHRGGEIRDLLRVVGERQV